MAILNQFSPRFLLFTAIRLIFCASLFGDFQARNCGSGNRAIRGSVPLRS